MAPGADAWYLDADGDAYGDDASVVLCTAPLGGSNAAETAMTRTLPSILWPPRSVTAATMIVMAALIWAHRTAACSTSMGTRTVLVTSRPRFVPAAALLATCPIRQTAMTPTARPSQARKKSATAMTRTVMASRMRRARPVRKPFTSTLTSMVLATRV